MRWVVELPAPSGGTAATVTVDADSWAGALTHARGGSPIKKFRCEFDADNVVRVLDLSSREWYTIRPIRAVAPEVASVPVVAPAPAPDPAPQPFALARDEDAAPMGATPSAAEAVAIAVEPPTAAVVPEVSAASSPEVSAPGEVAPPNVPLAEPVSSAELASTPLVAEPVPAAPSRPHDTLFGVPPARNDESRLVAVDESGEHQALPGGLAPPTLLFQRDQEPTESNPLAYRERVFVVPEGTAVGDAELVARHAVMALRRALATHPRGRYVVVAVFDHSFTTRPLRPALVEVRWKDWRGEVEVTHPAPAPAAPVNGAAHADASGSVDVSAVVAASASAPEEAVASAETAAPAATPVDAPAQVQVEVPPAESPAAFVAAAVEAPASDPVKESPAPVAEVPTAAPVVEAAAPAIEAAAPLANAPVVEAAAPVVEAAAPVVEAAAPVENAPAVEAVAPVEAVVVAPLEPAVATLPPPSVVASPGEASVVVELAAEPAPTAVTEAQVTPTTSSAEAAAPQGSEPAEVAQTSAAPTDVEPAPATPVATEAPAASLEPAAPAAVVQTAAPRRAPRTIARRTRGKDLLGELFDALMDLSHMESADAGCKQVVQILQEHLQCDMAAVSLYDIDRDEFVVNAAFGAEGVVGRRERAKVGVASTVVKRKAGVTLSSCGVDDVIHEDHRDGGGVFAPAMFRERLFALVRLHRVPGAEAFESDELDALSYVAAQLGEFLSTQSKRAAAAEFAPEPRRSQAPPRR